MFNKEVNSITDLVRAFPDESSCIRHLERLRWPDNKPISPFDPESEVYNCKGHKYHCKNSNKYFNVKTGTCFENSKLPLPKWFVAIYLVTSHKRGISSVQLAKYIGVTQKTAWFVLQRLRICFDLEDNEPPMYGVVEADECFIGGKNANRHAIKKVTGNQGRSFKDKVPVLGMLERATKRIKLFVIPSTSKEEIQPILYNNVVEGSTFYSDEWKAYHGIGSYFDHHIVDHSKKEYATGEGNFINTNSIENVWSILKRMYHGTYYRISRQHLQLYCYELTFRFNSRSLGEWERVNLLLRNTKRRLKWKTITTGEL